MLRLTTKSSVTNNGSILTRYWEYNSVKEIKVYSEFLYPISALGRTSTGMTTTHYADGVWHLNPKNMVTPPIVDEKE